MADKEVGIEIKTTVDTSGAEQAKEVLAAVAAAGEKASGTVNPMADGSQLRAATPDGDAAVSAVEEKTAAIKEQAEALADLTDEQAGVIDATKRLNEAAGRPDGFEKLFSQQRLIEIAREFGNLTRTVGQLAVEFSKTERGKELLAEIGEEAQTAGGLLLGVGSAVASGWAAGGPVGAALAGANELIKQVGDSFLAVAEAEQRAVEDFARTEAETIRRARERREVAADRAIAEAFEVENRTLGDQNEKLAENARLINARRDVRAANFELQQEQQRAEGVPEEQLRAERIRFEAQQEREQIRQAELRAGYEASIAERAANVARGNRDDIARTKGTNSPEFATADKAARDAEGAQADAARAAEVAAQEAEFRRQALEARTAARLQAEARQAREEAQRETERQADKARAEAEKAARERQQAGDRVGGIADQAATAAGRAGFQVDAALFERLGNAVEANPTEKGAAALEQAIERFAEAFESKDANESRRFRKMADDIEGLRAKLKTRGDGR